MDEMTNALVESAQDLIEELVSLLLNEAAMPVKIATTFVKTAVSFKEAFFWKKFSRLLEGGDLSEEERAKFYGKLEDENEEKKRENARRIIQIIDSAETEKKIYSLLFISQVFSASHWCMCSRIRAKAVAVSRLCVLKSISFHSQPWSATMQRLSG